MPIATMCVQLFDQLGVMIATVEVHGPAELVLHKGRYFIAKQGRFVETNLVIAWELPKRAVGDR